MFPCEKEKPSSFGRRRWSPARQFTSVRNRPKLKVGDPIILAYQLGREDATTWSHVKRAADFLVYFVSSEGYPAPYTPGERWENQSGYFPASTASEIAGLGSQEVK
jgi:hypothetical protein